MTRRILLHVGAPKTGTSAVQDVLFRNREVLAEHGILYPAHRFDAHFLAALDLMELTWGGLERQAVGAWDRLADEVRAWPGDVVISHEILAAASHAHVRRALESLGAGEGTRIEVVMSVRDLVRQIPAEWQENVKHRRVLTYDRFLRQVFDADRQGTVGTWFWAVQDVPAVLARWGEGLPPEQVHVVTVPPRTAPRDLLWQRFSAVLGLNDAGLDLQTSRDNPSMGAPETAFVRALNERLNHGVLPNEHFREFVRELVVHRTLATRSNPGARIGLPAPLLEEADRRCREWRTTLAERGYDVVGDLDDLVPEEGAGPSADPDATGPDELWAVAQDALVAVLVRAGQLREEVDTLRAERDEARAELGVGPWERTKRAVVARQDRPGLGTALRAYRHLRRR